MGQVSYCTVCWSDPSEDICRTKVTVDCFPSEAGFHAFQALNPASTPQSLGFEACPAVEA